MPSHHERQILPYTPQQMFDLVIDVEKYPEFLPWCRAARVFDPQKGSFLGELVIGFKAVRESYTSRIEFASPERIDVTMIRGPFDYLTNAWRFLPAPEGTEIQFDLNFRFNSRLLETVIGGLYTRATEKMVSAFRLRAEQLYGMPGPRTESGL